MNHERKIQVHLEHAKRKHPHLADALINERVIAYAERDLSFRRRCVEIDSGEGFLSAKTVLDCELAEVYEAIAAGRAEDAVEEIYDAVSVLLRMAEWINEKGCK